VPIDQIHLEFGGGGGGSGGGGGGGGGFDDLPTTNAGGNDIAAGGVEGDIASPNLFGSVPVYSRALPQSLSTDSSQGQSPKQDCNDAESVEQLIRNVGGGVAVRN